MRLRPRGFTLVELAVVLTIVVLLLGSLMYTLSAQTEQRNYEDTRRRLEQAREALLSFAIVNGRLPCPARSANTTTPATVAGDEVRNAAMQCSGDSGAGAVEDYYGGTSGAVTLGLVPARTIGITQVDPAGFAVDAWGNRLRYAVAKTKTNCVPATAPATLLDPHFVSSTNMKNNGVACQPNDLLICKSGTGITASTCGVTAPAGANQLMTSSLVVAIVFSPGKNGALTPGVTQIDELANLNGDPVFVFHPRTDSTFGNGEFDDQMTWITVGELYGRLIAAGVLP
ncbi:MAG TPA: prepilin-type N-terminal cleavage/methylation domain-containing protein [Burkholderiales bacterium]|nr:prepilin-type N-terminal cleavage/methylation domain-containing protein [Burkholderiales bacterium]